MECGPCVEVKFPQLLNLPLLPGEYLAGAEGHGIFEGRLWTKPRDKGVYLEKIRMQNCDNLRSRWRELKKKKKILPIALRTSGRMLSAIPKTFPFPSSSLLKSNPGRLDWAPKAHPPSMLENCKTAANPSN